MGYYGGYHGSGYVAVKNYGKDYRSMDGQCSDGVITIRSKGGWVGKVEIANNEIISERQWKNGKLFFAVKYGEFKKELTNGKVVNIWRFHKGSAQGLHGLCMRTDQKVFGQRGRCWSFYSRGSLIWQKFTYSNGRIAYYVRRTDREVKVVHASGKTALLIKVSALRLKGREATSFLCQSEREWSQKAEWDYSVDGLMCEYSVWDKRGRLQHQGKIENRQKVGEFIQNYQHFFYVSGVPVSKKLYYAKPEEIDPRDILKCNNAQAKAMLLKKVGYERVIKECSGKVIDRLGDYELIDFPMTPDPEQREADKVMRILKVVCPSTKGSYFLRVPPTDDFKSVMKARNGTFTGFEPKAPLVEFAIET